MSLFASLLLIPPQPTRPYIVLQNWTCLIPNDLTCVDDEDEDDEGNDDDRMIFLTLYRNKYNLNMVDIINLNIIVYNYVKS